MTAAYHALSPAFQVWAVLDGIAVVACLIAAIVAWWPGGGDQCGSR